MLFFFFNDTATTEIYTLSLHDALPISPASAPGLRWRSAGERTAVRAAAVIAGVTRRSSSSLSAQGPVRARPRSEEHTSELQSLAYLVCRLLLEKKKKV